MTMIETTHGRRWPGVDLRAAAEEYLINHGMAEEAVKALEARLQ